MKKKIFILFFMLIFLAPLINAQPPFDPQQTITSAPVLQIEFQGIFIYNMNEDITLHFHVYNSTGFIMDNTTTTCEIHIFNQSSHIVEQELIFGNVLDFRIDLNMSQFLISGTYSYLVYCNNTEAGFLSNTFFLNDTGEEKGNNIFPIIFVYIALIAMLIFVGFKTDEKNVGVRFGSFGFALIEIVFLSFIIYANEALISLIPLLKINFWFFVLSGFGIAIIALLRMTIRLMNPLDKMHEIDDDGKEEHHKWQGK